MEAASYGTQEGNKAETVELKSHEPGQAFSGLCLAKTDSNRLADVPIPAHA